MRNKITLIVGYGEIGSSLGKVLKKKYTVKYVDVNNQDEVDLEKEEVDVMHICFPPIPNFIEAVKAYQKRYKPRYTVIHSTVAVGTTKKCNAFHSPVRGVHPNIDKALTVFTKYLAPSNNYLKKYFESVEIPIRLVDKSETTEALKIWDTTYYGWNIMFEKMLFEWCQKHKVDYEMVYIHANHTYNWGYTQLKKSNVVRPVLKHMEGGIGGHCVMQNLELIPDTAVAKFIKENEQRFKMPKVRRNSSRSK